MLSILCTLAADSLPPNISLGFFQKTHGFSMFLSLSVSLSYRPPDLSATSAPGHARSRCPVSRSAPATAPGAAFPARRPSGAAPEGATGGAHGASVAYMSGKTCVSWCAVCVCLGTTTSRFSSWV